MQLNLIRKNNENILPICFIGNNRNQEVLNYHQKIMEKFKIPINYITWDFSKSGHGDAAQFLINLIIDSPDVDYLWFCDMDLIPLKEDFVDIMYEKISDKNTVFGPCLATNHRGFKDHLYAGLCCLAFSKQLYIDLDKPDLRDLKERSDNGQELTWRAEEEGKNVCFMFPKSYNNLTEEEIKSSGNPEYFALGQYFKYGLGTVFGDDMIFHAFMQNLPRSAEVFIQKCEEILNKSKKVEAIIICKKYEDYLNLTLPENKQYFDNIIIVVDKFDSPKFAFELDDKIKIVEYDGFNKNGSKFNFGGARNEGLKYLKYDDWVVFIDSDILVRENFKDKLTDVSKFYGSYRRFIPKYRDYISLVDNYHTTKLLSFKRIDGHGCGFLQIFSVNHPIIKKYGLHGLYEDSYSAEYVDIQFLRKFCKFENNQYENLVNLNTELWHLGFHGINNEGRKENDGFFD